MQFVNYSVLTFNRLFIIWKMLDWTWMDCTCRLCMVIMYVVLQLWAGALVQLPAWKIGDRGFESHSGLQISKKQNISFPITRKDSILWGASVPRDSVLSLRPGSNFESCVWRAVSSHSSHHPQELFMVSFSLYVHTSGLKSHSFHFCSCNLIHFDTLWDRH